MLKEVHAYAALGRIAGMKVQVKKKKKSVRSFVTVLLETKEQIDRSHAFFLLFFLHFFSYSWAYVAIPYLAVCWGWVPMCIYGRTCVRTLCVSDVNVTHVYLCTFGCTCVRARVCI